MASLISIREVMMNDDQMDADYINPILNDIYAILCERPELAGRLHIVLSERETEEKMRYTSLPEYHGPDTETVRFLERYSNLWMQDPGMFWSPRQRYNLTFYPAEAQIIGAYLQAESDNNKT